MQFNLLNYGNSRSFPEPHPLLDSATPFDASQRDIAVLVGENAGSQLDQIVGERRAILVELYTECLGVWTGESRAEEGSNVLGFARFRVGDDDPSDLVELVRQPGTSPEAIAAATQLFESAGFTVAVCMDQAGRIIDRLMRPYFNEVLTRLDQGLATASDMDLTLKLGLGYPEGPIGLLERSGLHHHYDVTQALFEVYGTPAFAPARRAAVAKQRKDFEDN